MSFAAHIERIGAARASAPALVYYPDGEGGGLPLSYADLFARAQALAEVFERAQLRGRSVVLVFPAGHEFTLCFVACVLAGVIAVPLPVPRQRSREQWRRFASVMRDCAAELVVCGEGVQAGMVVDSAAEAGLATPVVEFSALAQAELRPPRTAPSLADAVFLQYTSGSTASPKGCVVTHGNLLHNAAATAALMRHGADSVLATWLPHSHDLGLIGNLLQGLYVGACVHFMAPAAFVQKPHRWLHMISAARATTAMSPNFGYQLCVDRIKDEDLDGLDLSSWKVALNGAEPVRMRTLDAFSQRFGRCGFDRASFLPAYGLAEATLIVTAEHSTATERDVVSCGRPLEGLALRIADEHGADAPDGAIGEVMVRGPSVSPGYWGSELQSAPELATGDLGFLHDGRLHVMGRKKDTLIANGRKLFAVDVEQVAELSHAAIEPAGACAFALERDGREAVVLLLELRRTALRTAPRAEIESAVRAAVAAEFEAVVDDIVFLPPHGLPKTTSGKHQRSLAREQYRQGAFRDAVPERGEVPQPAPRIEPPVAGPRAARLRHEIRAWIRGRFPEARIADDAQFSDMGFDSVVAIEFALELEQLCERPVEATIVWDYSCIDAVVGHLTGPPPPAAAPASPAKASLDDLLSRARDVLARQ